jgi:hypothetical protein
VDKDIVPDVGAFMNALAKAIDAVEKAAGSPPEPTPRKAIAKKPAPPARKSPPPQRAPARKPR